MVDQRKFFEMLHISREEGGIIYRALADRIQAAIQSGMLKPGDRLPTQRHIAKQLQINLSTVTQAFRLLREKGHIITRTGSGSIVATPWNDTEADYPSAPIGGESLDMTVNRPATHAFLDSLAPLLRELPLNEYYGSLQDYHPPNGPLWAREAVARWLVSNGAFAHVDADDLVITQGAQHALACVLRALTKPGDIVLADAITYQGIMALCYTLGLPLYGVAMDKGGMSAAALEAACKKYKPRVLITIPTMHNPTAITLSKQRRHQICDVTSRHNVTIIEDDVYRPLYDENLPTLFSMTPAHTYYISGFSKSVAPGLRIGFVLAPRHAAVKIATTQRIDLWCASPLNTLIMTCLLDNGNIDTIVEQNKAELRQRQALLVQHLEDFDITTHPTSTHAWLQLPQPWTTSRFITSLRARGVSTLGSDMFATDFNSAPQAVRLNVAGIRSHNDLSKALTIIADTLWAPDCYSPGAF